MSDSIHPKAKTFALTKREATLLVHVREHFPKGFLAEDLAGSLGWSLEEVQKAARVCVSQRLLVPPGRKGAPTRLADKAREWRADDLLTPKEQEEARQTQHPCTTDWLLLGETLAVLRALQIGCKGSFTDLEASGFSPSC